MLNYDNGKKLVLGGFGLHLLISVIYTVILLASMVLGFYTGIVITRLLNLADCMSLGIAAVGFLVMWMSERKNIDLISGAATGISAFVYLLNWLGLFKIHGSLINYIYLAIISCFLLALALRVKDSNMFIALLLGCAFVYRLFSSAVFFNLFLNRLNLPYFLVLLVWYLGYVACSGIAFFAVLKEK